MVIEREKRDAHWLTAAEKVGLVWTLTSMQKGEESRENLTKMHTSSYLHTNTRFAQLHTKFCTFIPSSTLFVGRKTKIVERENIFSRNLLSLLCDYQTFLVGFQNLMPKWHKNLLKRISREKFSGEWEEEELLCSVRSDSFFFFKTFLAVTKLF